MFKLDKKVKNHKRQFTELNSANRASSELSELDTLYGDYDVNNYNRDHYSLTCKPPNQTRKEKKIYTMP